MFPVLEMFSFVPELSRFSSPLELSEESSDGFSLTHDSSEGSPPGVPLSSQLSLQFSFSLLPDGSIFSKLFPGGAEIPSNSLTLASPHPKMSMAFFSEKFSSGKIPIAPSALLNL